MQEAWVGITKGLARLRDPATFRRWSFTIVTRAAWDRLRHRPVEATASGAPVEDLEASEDTGDERGQAEATGDPGHGGTLAVVYHRASSMAVIRFRTIGIKTCCVPTRT